MATSTAQCLSTERDLPAPQARPAAGSVRLRCAGLADARDVAQLIALASGGIATWHWGRLAGDGQDPLAVGAARVAQWDGIFSYRNAVLAEQGGAVAGMMLGYWLDGVAPGDGLTPDGPTQILQPLAELEAQVPGSYAIKVLAVYDGHRDSGLGTRLLQAAASRATAMGCTRLSAQVLGRNLGAIRLYERNGFRTVDSRPIAPHPGRPYDDRVLLMLRAL